MDTQQVQTKLVVPQPKRAIDHVSHPSTITERELDRHLQNVVAARHWLARNEERLRIAALVCGFFAYSATLVLVGVML